MERLKISENKRYFVKANGEPFIWLADTAWTMPQRMKDILRILTGYLIKRKNMDFMCCSCQSGDSL